MWKTSRLAARRRSTSGIVSGGVPLRIIMADASAAGLPVSRAAPASASSSRARENRAVIARQNDANNQEEKSDWQQEKPKNPGIRSEEHTSELQSLRHLVCRL